MLPVTLANLSGDKKSLPRKAISLIILNFLNFSVAFVTFTLKLCQADIRLEY